MIESVAVVVPARDEDGLIRDCLASVHRALRHPAVAALPAVVVVAADACRDDTAPTARRAGARVLEVDRRSAGAARALGTAHALDLLRAGTGTRAVPPDRIWLAHTDADSEVPPTWLADQLVHAAAGAHAVAGLVEVRDWSGHAAVTARRFAQRYGPRPLPGPEARQQPQHAHVHGAHLGVRADAYLAVGGFPPVPVGEDQALADALALAGYQVHASCDARVVTSARRDPRAAGGFGDYLLALEH